MFLIRELAHKERPIECKSDLWNVLDEKLYKHFSKKQLSCGGVGFVKQHAIELLKSYYDFGLMDNRRDFDIEDISTFVESYIHDRFWVSSWVTRKVEVVASLDPVNWKSRG